MHSINVLALILLGIFQVFVKGGKSDDASKTALEELQRLSLDAQSYFIDGDYITYNLYLDTIIQIARANENKRFEVRALGQKGVASERLGEYEKALTYHLQAMDLMENLDGYSLEIAVGLINLSNLYNQIGSYDEASEAAKKAISNADGLAIASTIQAGAYITLAEVNAGQQSYDSALYFHGQALEIGEQTGQPSISLVTLIGIADCYNKMNQFTQALEASSKGLALHDSTTSSESISLNYLVHSKALGGLKEYQESIVYGQQALELAQANGYLSTQMYSQKQLAESFEALGKYESAHLANKNFIETRESYLTTLSEAKRLDVEKELENQNQLISSLSVEKQRIIFIGLIILVFVVGTLLLLIMKKRAVEDDYQKSVREKELLKDQNASLQSRLRDLAQKQQESESQPYAKSSLTTEEREKYMKQILEYTEEEKPYLNPDINQSEMAANLELSLHIFSEVLNTSFDMNFNQFMNLYRVNEVKSYIDDPEYKNYKIIALGYKAGFKSKSSFNRVFKNMVGVTPSEYREQVLVES